MKSKSEHAAMPCTDRATPVTTDDAMVNDPVGTVDLENSPTFDDHPPVADTSFAAFLVEVAEAEE